MPKKGEIATFYLTGGGKEPFEVVTPNGVVVGKAPSIAQAGILTINEIYVAKPPTAPEWQVEKELNQDGVLDLRIKGTIVSYDEDGENEVHREPVYGPITRNTPWALSPDRMSHG